MPDTLLDAVNSKKKRDSSCPQRADSLVDMDPQAMAMQYIMTTGHIRVQAKVDEVLIFLGESRQSSQRRQPLN